MPEEPKQTPADYKPNESNGYKKFHPAATEARVHEALKLGGYWQCHGCHKRPKSLRMMNGFLSCAFCSAHGERLEWIKVSIHILLPILTPLELKHFLACIS